MKRKNGAREIDYLLLAILVISLLVRLWGIKFGLPLEIARPDEAYVVYNALSFGAISLNPGTFIYPTFMMYMLFIFYGLYFLAGLITGKYGSIYDVGLQYRTDPSIFYLINRLLSVFLGVLTVYALYKLVRLLFERRAGLLAAFFLALSYLHVRESHFGTFDVAVTFFILTSLYFIMRYFKEGNWRDMMLGGVLAGLGASTKYISLLMLFPAFLAIVLRMNGKRKRSMRLGVKMLGLFVISFGLSFLFGTPYALLNFGKFFQDLLLNFTNTQRVWGGIDLGSGWLYHWRFSLVYGVGWMMLLAAFFGAGWFIKRDWQLASILLAFPVLYYLTIGGSKAVFVRYSLPVVPFICLIAGVFISKLTESLGKRLSFSNNFLLVLISLFVLKNSIANIVAMDTLLVKKDSRVVATEWIDEHVEDGSTVYQNKQGTILLSPNLNEVRGKYNEKLNGTSRGDLNVARVLQMEMEHISSRGREGYYNLTYNEEGGSFFYKDKEILEFPDYIVVERNAFLGFKGVPDKILLLLEEKYKLVWKIEAVDINDERNLYDQQDEFYLPYAGFHDVERPGPNIYIYSRKKV